MRTERIVVTMALLWGGVLNVSESAAQPPSPGSQLPLLELVRQLDPSRSPTERLQAAEAIAGYGQRAVPHLVALLGHENRKGRLSACLALSRMGPAAVSAVPRLNEALDDEDHFVRKEASYALGRIGPEAADAAPRLVGLFGDSDLAVRRAAISAVARIGRGAATPVIDALQSPDRQVQLAACLALEEMTTEAGFAVHTLVGLCRDSDAELQDAVFLTFGNVGHEAVDPLVELLHSPDIALRRRAAMSLGRIGPPAAAAVPGLRRVLFDEASEVRFWAAKALGEIGPDARASIDDLVTACSDPDPDVRWQAAVSLEIIGDHDTADRALSGLCDDPHEAVRRWAETRLTSD